VKHEKLQLELVLVLAIDDLQHSGIVFKTRDIGKI